MSDLQHCINCLRETQGFYPYPCQQCDWSPEQHGESGLYLSPGTILHNQYQIARMLGHGGFGITYLAWDTLLEIKLAIKEYLPRDFATRNSTNAEISTFAGDAKENFAFGLERFLEEARTLAKFQQHAGIVSVLNFFKGNGTGYMVMEYVDGLTLKDYLADEGKLSWEQTLELFMPVMDALREVHKHGVLHRDISPDNIYLCQDNRIKLLDFGSARYALGGHSRSLSVVVKPGYAPEEQYRAKGKQGAWTDVYSVAASMYRCITGVVPPEALDRLDEDELARPSELGVQVPAEAEEALVVALAVKAENRTQSIESFQQALWKKMDSEPVTAMPTATTKLAKPPLKEEPNHSVNVDALKNKDAHDNGGRTLTGFLVIVSSAIWDELKQKLNGWRPLCIGFLVIISFPFFYFQSIYLSNQQATHQASLEEAIKFYDQENYDKALNIFRPAAEQGFAKAQYNLGNMYVNGQGVPKDYQQAILWYRKSAAQGFAESQYNLGVMYFNGQGVQQDDQLAVQWYRKAADQGFADAETKLGWMYEKGQGAPKDYQQAVQWYRKAAEQGHAWGQYSLGDMYINGHGVGKDYKKAVEWYRKAAEQGHVWGQNRLGSLYEIGQGVQQDYQQALQWYRKAAEQGHSGGQESLGGMYKNGYGVNIDYQKAVVWYRKAADQGEAIAQDELGLMYDKGQGVQKDDQQAVQWYRKAAEQGLANAEYNLGTMYYNGQGIEQDYQQAEQWFRKAAKQGYKDAIRALTGLAAEQGNAAAQYKVGLMFANGQGVQQDYQQAEQWFRKAAKQGDKDAIRALKGLGASVEIQPENPADKAEPVKLPSYKLGDRLPDGGIVFYIDASGKHGLAAQPADEYGAVTWHTASLLPGQNGSGWHLPTKDELGLLYPQKNVVGGFADEYYWSSTELDSSNAWYQSFIYGSQNNTPKGSTFRVRAVRAF